MFRGVTVKLAFGYPYIPGEFMVPNTSITVPESSSSDHGKGESRKGTPVKLNETMAVGSFVA